MIVFSLPFVFIYAKRHWRQLMAIVCICLVVFGFTRSVLLPAFQIEKGYVREPLSIPIQQIARPVKEHGDELTEEQKLNIDEILPYDQLKELYEPGLSDNVKSAFDRQAFQSNPGIYIELWLQLGVKYP